VKVVDVAHELFLLDWAEAIAEDLLRAVQAERDRLLRAFDGVRPGG
jgi:hypothetical protein